MLANHGATTCRMSSTCARRSGHSRDIPSSYVGMRRRSASPTTPAPSVLHSVAAALSTARTCWRKSTGAGSEAVYSGRHWGSGRPSHVKTPRLQNEAVSRQVRSKARERVRPSAFLRCTRARSIRLGARRWTSCETMGTSDACNQTQWDAIRRN